MPAYALIDNAAVAINGKTPAENVIEYDPEGDWPVPEGRRVEPFNSAKHVWPPAEG